VTRSESIGGAGQEPPDADGQIVIVRPAVVENVGHVIGNLFQRIYHLIEESSDADPATAAQLQTSTRELEDFLQLAIDYFSPLSLALQYVPVSEVAQGLARQLSDHVARPVKLDVKVPVEARALVDPGRVARAFRLLALQLRSNVAGSDDIELNAATQASGRSFGLRVALPDGLLPGRSSVSEMQWAVAEKFLEVHGGTLQRNTVHSGEVSWDIVLPLKS